MPDHDRRVIELPTLYHLATAEAWDPDAEEPYTVSTLGRTLDEEGFIRLSLASAFYQGKDIFLLSLNPHLLSPRPVRPRPAPRQAPPPPHCP